MNFPPGGQRDWDGKVGNEAELKTALKERKVQFEMFFTLPDFSDISLRDYHETMQRPFFSLSKRKRLKPIEYVSPDKSVTVHVSPNPTYGMATIWDADIMIDLASQLNELRERGLNDLSPVVRLQPGDRSSASAGAPAAALTSDW